MHTPGLDDESARLLLQRCVQGHGRREAPIIGARKKRTNVHLRNVNKGGDFTSQTYISSIIMYKNKIVVLYALSAMQVQGLLDKIIRKSISPGSWLSSRIKH